MRIPPALLVTLLLAALLLATPAVAQDFTPAQRQEVVKILRESLAKDPSILRDALVALQSDDTRRHDKVTSDVIAMLGPRLVDANDPVAGNPLGDITMVEFYDTRCPYCRQMSPVVAELLRTDPRLKLVIKDLPILGPSSQLESRALLAAQKQGAYFKLQDPVMHLGGTSTRDSLRDLADHLGLDGAHLLRDIDDPSIKARLQTNIDLAQQLGIDGTPAFIIGTRMIAGAADLKELQQAIAEARKR